MLPAGPAALGLLRCACCMTLSRRRKPPACPLLSPIATAGFDAGAQRSRGRDRLLGGMPANPRTHLRTACSGRERAAAGHSRLHQGHAAGESSCPMFQPCFNYPQMSMPSSACLVCSGCWPGVYISLWPTTHLEPPTTRTLQAFREERLIHRRYAFEIILQV